MCRSLQQFSIKEVLGERKRSRTSKWFYVMDLKSSKIIYWEDTTDEEIIEENIGINPKESSVKVICRNKSGKCSFDFAKDHRQKTR